MADVVLKNVNKLFDKSVPAVRNVNLEIKDQEFVVLVGPSGCGKSTSLRMIAGLEEVTDGEIHIDGRLVNDVPPKDRDIAMVFQNYALYPHMTVYENMAFGLKLRKYPKAEIEERVNEAAAILSIGHLLSRKPKALSGGERQRVAVGRAIVRKPKVFLFDEPLSNLDAKLRVQMRTEISKLHNSLSATMIYVTHDQVEAMTMGDRIAVMKDGEVLQVADPIHLYENPVNKFVAGFIGSPGMNFMDGRIVTHEDKLVFNEGHLLLTIPDDMQKAMAAYKDQEVTFGIRPEDVAAEGTVKDWSAVQDISATVEVVEPMGSETFLYLTTGKHPFIAKVEAHVEPKLNTEIPLVVNMANVHFFRKDNEATII
jgi:multiple sugar transport system ATP-binding protein